MGLPTAGRHVVGLSFLSPRRGWCDLSRAGTHGLRRGLRFYAPSELGGWATLS